jgi:hypothetical protein
MQNLIKSKRFWAAVSSVIVVLAADRLPFTEQQINDIVMVIAVWIVGDSLREVRPVTPRR